MSMHDSMRRFAAVAVSAVTLLALSPMGAANAAGPSADEPISVPVVGTETITIQGDEAMLKGHQFKAVRVGTYQNATGDASTGSLSGVAVGTDSAVLKDAEDALASVRDIPADSGYVHNPMGEVVAHWLGYASSNANNRDTTSDSGSAADAWDGVLRKFVTKLSSSKQFQDVLSQNAVATGTVSDPDKDSQAGAKATMKIEVPSAGIYVLDDVTDKAAVPSAGKNSIPMLVGTGITVGGTVYSQLDGRMLGLVDIKNDAPSVSKELDPSKMNNASIGGVLNYKLTGAVPLTTGFNHYIYTMVDRPSSLGLHYVDGSAVVTIKDAAGKLITLTEGTDYTVTAHVNPASAFKSTAADASNDYVIFDLSPSILDSRFHYQNLITVTYKMMVTDDADGTALKNGVTLSYSNDVNHQPAASERDGKTHATIDPTTGVVTDGGTDGSLVSDSVKPGAGVSTAYMRNFSLVAKSKAALDAASDADKAKVPGLPGAVFSLLQTTNRSSDPIKFLKVGDGVYKRAALQDSKDSRYTADLAVGSNGMVSIAGLSDGDYTVTEITDPTGYSSLCKPSFIVTLGPDTSDESKTMYTNRADVLGLVDAQSSMIASDGNPIVVRAVTSVSQLPLTGGAGIALGLLVIAVLAVATALLVMAHHRLDE